MTMIKNFFGTSDYFGNNNTTHKYNELVKKLKKMGLSDDDINSIMHDVSEIESDGYRNGEDNARKEVEEYC